MVVGINEKASVHNGAKATAQRTAGQSVKQNWDCSQIENEEEGEEENLAKGKPDGSAMGVDTEAERMEEEVLDKYKVEDSNREAYRGKGNPLEWRLVRRSKKDRIKKWREDCWARIFALVQRVQRAASAKHA